MGRRQMNGKGGLMKSSSQSMAMAVLLSVNSRGRDNGLGRRMGADDPERVRANGAPLKVVVDWCGCSYSAVIAIGIRERNNPMVNR